MNRRIFLGTAGATSLAVITGIAGDPNPIPAPARRIRTSLNAYSFNQALLATDGPSQMSLMDLLDFCAEQGFDAVDPTGYYFPGYPKPPSDEFIADFKREAARLGLEISGTGVRNNFANPDKDQRAADLEHVKNWIDVAQKLGAPVIRVFAGAVPEGYDDRWAEPARWLTDALRECVSYGRKRGVLIGLQNHADLLKTAAQTLEIVRAVNSAWLGVIVDTGNFYFANDPYAEIAAVLPHAVNFQVKESVRGLAGTERIDLKRLVRLVRSSSYRGYLPIETLALKGRDYTPRRLVPEFLRELQAAIAGG